MVDKMRILLAILLLGAMGCSPMMKHAREKYPNCLVEKVDNETVLVRCRGQVPFEKKLRKTR